MSRTLEVADDVYLRIRQLARFGGCTESEVIRRLLDSLEGDDEPSVVPIRPIPSRDARADPSLPGRAARERGAKIRLGADVFHVNSVRDLFETVMRYLNKAGKGQAVKALLPLRTSAQRYLIAEKPIHPNGNNFFVPIQVGSFYMEAHKSYRQAVADLEDFLPKVGVEFEYISG